MSGPCLSFLGLRAVGKPLVSRIPVRIPAMSVSKLAARPQTRQFEKAHFPSRIPVAVRAKPSRVTSSLVQRRKTARVSRPRPWLEETKPVATVARTRSPPSSLARPRKASKTATVPPKAPKEPVLCVVAPTLLPAAGSATTEEKSTSTKPDKRVRFAEAPVVLGGSDEDHELRLGKKLSGAMEAVLGPQALLEKFREHEPLWFANCGNETRLPAHVDSRWIKRRNVRIRTITLATYEDFLTGVKFV